MIKKLSSIAAAALCTAISTTIFAASPIPSFDKEAVTTHPYNRIGEQDVSVKSEQSEAEAAMGGNTGTAEKPAFYVREIVLSGFELPDELGELKEILGGYTRRSVSMDELKGLTSAVTDYARRRGFTVVQAVVPPQQVENGKLEIRVYVASYDRITLTRNESAVADRVLRDYIARLCAAAIRLPTGSWKAS